MSFRKFLRSSETFQMRKIRDSNIKLGNKLPTSWKS